MLSNTLRENFCYLKIIHILRPHYHPKTIGYKISKRSVSFLMKYKINDNENGDENEKQIT